MQPVKGPSKNAAKKEHKEHQKALKPLLSHLKTDEKKLAKKKTTKTMR